MDIQKLHHDGLSVSEIARRLDMDRKTVPKYTKQAPTRYERQPKGWKVDPWRSYLRERWEQGVENGSRLFVVIQKRGYTGGSTQVKKVLRPWRSEGRERAFVRFGRAGADGLGPLLATGMTGVFTVSR